MSDEKHYRKNVGITLINNKQQIFIAKRCKQDVWQLPQGGVDKNETILNAMFRELNEEIGLKKNHIEIISKMPQWLYYDIPETYRKQANKSKYIGQKQLWFLLKLVSSDKNIKLDTYKIIEFDKWQWVDYWYPLKKVVSFKKQVYKKMLETFLPIVFNKKQLI